MISLEAVKSSLNNIILGISDTFNIEVAIFDKNYKLVASTKPYLEKKGKSVHTPSLKEVLSNGNVLVNKPGYMKSCIGCRFKDRCPATIELLNCITLKSDAIGVIALTSFTKEGHDRLEKNIDKYLNILREVSNLIAMIALQQHKKDAFIHLDHTLQVVMDSSMDSLFIIDRNGQVTHYNHSALKFFSFCNLHTNSINQILPNTILQEILEGNTISNKYIKNENFHAFVSSFPLKKGNRFMGSVIRLDQKNTSKSNKKKTSTIDSSISLDMIKGNSKAIQDLKRKVQKISKSTSSILITGETGTGKELLAKAIHYNSNRANFPLVAINCASIPESLFESELFGYEEGAFTGAKKGGKPGRFELAQGGTLFLDEIGEMPLFMQSKLLRVLQDHTIERVGSTRSVPIDIRIIAATNKNLEDMVLKKEFRADLYYRLNVIPLTLPPLRQRKDDIEILAMHFLKKYSLKLNKKLIHFSPEAMYILQSYHWPGNIRELENTVEYAVNMEEENIITQNSLPERLLKININIENQLEIKNKIKTFELNAIIAALDKYGWDVKGKTKAAKELGIGLRTLYRKIKMLENMDKKI
ncbi:AAA family ATPase [Crassaminicella thermophila]|uniref:AAA family ATPase n=1 Tax=Crassaminicella thermophila TaxID=2599308 RepID=A0A5C0SDJ9_CRATE|nr:sigma 54-interacting transcriptional regulator [Crassaminicella thermophila]QEK11836.1 AAA family ATPase [Crassaminicella thermophila]